MNPPVIQQHSSSNNIAIILIGALTSSTIGSFLFQALGTLVLGIVGALGGYLFVKLIKPQLDKLFDKIKKKKA